VVEGADKFEENFNKVRSASNPNQKEKYEEDLKKEIKKLQRLRDQIKTWIASGAVNDKTLLTEKRKYIESVSEALRIPNSLFDNTGNGASVF
jgi:CCR4-NOT transcription complex subunit 3